MSTNVDDSLYGLLAEAANKMTDIIDTFAGIGEKRTMTDKNNVEETTCLRSVVAALA